MQAKKDRFFGQELLLLDPNNLEESVRKQFEAMVIEPKDILRWEDDGGQIIRPLDSPTRLYGWLESYPPSGGGKYSPTE